MAWLNEKDVVRLLLRAHLHQRQYMEQVPSLADLRHVQRLPPVQGTGFQSLLQRLGTWVSCQ